MHHPSPNGRPPGSSVFHFYRKGGSVLDTSSKLDRPSVRRLVILGVLFLLIFGVFAVRLYTIQITEHDAYQKLADGGSRLTLPIAASRGEIRDRNLNPLVVNQTAYAVVFDYNYFPTGTSDEARDRQNALILDLCALLTEAGESWNDTLPLTATAPYAFAEERESSVAALKKTLRLGDYATADNCMAALIEKYHLEAYDAPSQRLLAGIQYEMTTREFGAFNAFTFSSGVSKETSYLISENTTRFPGVDIQTTAVRQYVSGTTAPHLIGTVGPMYAEDYAALKDQGYALNDTLGKSGVEAAFESSLRGTAGKRVLTKDSTGRVIGSQESVSPVPGSTVVLTLDSDLQAAAQQILADKIAELRARPSGNGSSFLNNGHDVTSGAVVVLDVKDGGVLAAATSANYDLSTYTENYTALLNDPEKPLFNRALYGAFACGSTMKPCIAVAALSEGIITPTSTYSCGYTYNRFSSSGLTLHCMHSHGSINVFTALQKSCNIFFYEAGLNLGIERMNAYSTKFGLGQRTGIEVGESAGVLAGPEHSASVGRTWTPGDTATAAIGQSDNLFTPIQLAAYAMTLANDGVRYETHLLHSLLSYDGVVQAYEPKVAATLEMSQETIDAVRAGMIAVGKSGGTAASAFARAPYTIACKTGTAQVSRAKSDHGAFIGYAPADDPQVAIAVVLENGTSSPSAAVARAVLDAYFDVENESAGDLAFGQLLP